MTRSAIDDKYLKVRTIVTCCESRRCGIYQEKVFSGTPHRVNVVYMLAWASLAQAIVLLCAFPINFIPWFGSMRPDQAGIYLENATACLAYADGMPKACAGSASGLVFCVLAMLATSIVQTFLVKYSSAVLSVFVITLVTPVSAFAFTWEFLMGPITEQANVLQVRFCCGVAGWEQNPLRRA